MVEFNAALKEALAPLGVDAPVMEAPRSPVRLKDLIAELRASSPKTIALSTTVTLDVQRRCLVVGTETIELTEKEADLLRALAANPEGLSREALLSQVWGYAEDVDTHTLETHIHRLRAKLKPLPEAEEMIKTTADGYTLKPHV